MPRSTKRILLALALAVASSRLASAQAYDSSAHATGTTNPLTFPLTTTAAANQAGCVLVYADQRPTAGNVTVGGNIFTAPPGSTGFSMGGNPVSFWCGVIPSGAVNTVSVTLGTTPAFNVVLAGSYNGVSSAIDAFNATHVVSATDFDVDSTNHSVAANTIAVGWIANTWDSATAYRQTIGGGSPAAATGRETAHVASAAGLDLVDTNTTIGPTNTAFSMGASQGVTPPEWVGFSLTFAPGGGAAPTAAPSRKMTGAGK